MSTKVSYKLLGYALDDLYFLGYEAERIKEVPEKQLYWMADRNGNRFKASLQYRNDKDCKRYTFGIGLNALKKADFFVPWMQNCDKMYLIPKEFLLDIFNLLQVEDLARFSGEYDDRWRVDFYPEQNELHPQSPKGFVRAWGGWERSDISAYAHRSRQLWKIDGRTRRERILLAKDQDVIREIKQI